MNRVALRNIDLSNIHDKSEDIANSKEKLKTTISVPKRTVTDISSYLDCVIQTDRLRFATLTKLKDR